MKDIEDREAVVYGVVGHRPEVGCMRLERRGYELQIVAHYGCWYSRKRGWSRVQTPLERLLNALVAEEKKYGR
jgi:hypothetical protein